MSDKLKFMHWMMKIKNIYYTNDNLMSLAMEEKF